MDKRPYVRQLATNRILVSRTKNLEFHRLLLKQVNKDIDMIWRQKYVLMESLMTTSLS